MNYDNKKKLCYLLSGFTDLEDKKGWTAGLVETVIPTPPTSPTSDPPTLPTGSTPVTGVTGSTPVTGVTGSTPKPTITLMKNKFYNSKKSDLLSKTKTKSAGDCLQDCMVKPKLIIDKKFLIIFLGN